MTLTDWYTSPARAISKLLASAKRLFNFAEERTNRAVRFFHVVRAYKAGEPVKSIAARFECSTSTVLRYARIAGLAKRPKASTPHAAILADYRAGLPIAEISRRHGCSQALVSKLATEAGINRKKKRIA